jgi:hypothetical protein
MSISQPPDSIHESLSLSGEQQQMQTPKWLSKGKSVRRATREFVADNAGLLLVILSQAFFSMMNAAVKLLSTVDPPVTALQVCLLAQKRGRTLGLTHQIGVVDFGTNGVLFSITSTLLQCLNKAQLRVLRTFVRWRTCQLNLVPKHYLI